ncbi:MAG: 16S rRNA (adenine(1518)-N(6)/adenine(1519)-N(6))-dimethyltransferase RsmA [Sulfolobales archaeon]
MELRYLDLDKITKYLLRLHGVRARRKLSQHFIVDRKLLYEVLEHVSKLRPSRVVEIGTGLGLLTACLSDVANYVVSVELDSKLAGVAVDFLNREVGFRVVDVLVGDGLLLLHSGLREADIIVSNVPYSITGPLINSIVKSNCRAAVLTLQNEVAERLTALPGSKGYSRLTAMVNTFMNVELGGLYPPSSFTPRPKVYSRVVVLMRIREWSDEWRVYEDLIRCLFNQKRKLARKVLRNCLRGSLSGEDVLKLESLTEGKRVYQLDVETLLNIYSIVRRITC